ncbi:phosphotransferase [Streptosporangium sandarakinum]
MDFGTSGVGDPACDLVVAWTHFAGDERKVFREAAGLPHDAWRRARGRALWKALVTMVRSSGSEAGTSRVASSLRPW